MEIKNLGGEFALIERIKKSVKSFSKNVFKGIGDDAAVLKWNGKGYMLFTTDTLVENVHFSLKHSSAEQVGMKAIEQNASDIAAMGGIPKYAVISLALPENTDVRFVDGLYSGINKKAKKHIIDVVGGNITRSKEIAVTVAMIGFVEKKYLALRSGAKIGDLIFCSGSVGKSAAGLELLKRNLRGRSIKKHLEPECRMDLARKLVKTGISSMIDVSDGVASEVGHVCSKSDVGAVIYADKIPVSKNTLIDAKKAGKSAVDLALYGGEDFELLFTAPKDKSGTLRKYGARPIGEIVNKRYGIKIIKNSKILKSKRGFEHFKNA